MIQAASVWSPLEKYERQPNIKVLQIQLETFLTNRRSNLCQITGYISAVMCSLRSLDNLNRFSRSSHRRCSVKKDVLKKLCKFNTKTPVSESLVIKLKASNFIKKETPPKIFPCEIHKIFNYSYIQKHLLTTASDFSIPAYPFPSLFGKFYPLQYQQSTK